MAIRHNTSKSALLLFIAIPLIMVLVSASRIINLPVEPIGDQLYLIMWGVITEWPLHLERHLSCVYMLRIIYNFFPADEPIGYNTVLRIFTMALYLTAGAMLLRSIIGKAQLGLYMLFMLLLYTSRFIFLWTSTELFAGAFLMLLLWSITTKRSFPVVAFFLILFSFAKADLIFSGAITGIFLTFVYSDSWRGRMINLCVLCSIGILFLVPAFLQSGRQAIQPEGRSMLCLSDNYAWMIAPHQVTPVQGYKWTESEKIFTPIWGKHEKVSEAILSNSKLYFDFIFLSLGNTVLSICKSWIIFLILPAAYGLLTREKNQIKTAAALLLTGFIPITLFAFLHVRYAARFYPIFLVFALIGLKRLPVRGKLYRCMIIYFSIIVALQMYFFIPVFQSAYWFPD